MPLAIELRDQVAAKLLLEAAKLVNQTVITKHFALKIMALEPATIPQMARMLGFSRQSVQRMVRIAADFQHHP